MRLPAVAFRPCTPDDLPLVADWLARPHVARWWREDPAPAAVAAKYLPYLDGRVPTELFILETDGAPAGLFQRYLAADHPQWAAALRDTALGGTALGGTALGGTAQPGAEIAVSIDYLIGKAELTGRGLGTVAITAFTRLALARYPAAGLVAVAVSQDNIASWRALEKSGYRRCWAGELASDHPSDEGPMYLYRLDRGETGSVGGVDRPGGRGRAGYGGSGGAG